jgi:hypothetical protein
MGSVVIGFGEGEAAPRREVRVTHRRLRHGGSWSFYLCPGCGKRARLLRLVGGQAMCRWCCCSYGIHYRIYAGSVAERAQARADHVERLRQRLAGHLRRRRATLELSLRRAQVVSRETLLEPINRLKDGGNVVDALVAARGSVPIAAKALGMQTRDLRELALTASPALSDTIFEELECAIDKAVQVIWDGMMCGSLRKRIKAAGLMLRYAEAARRRGFSSSRKG